MNLDLTQITLVQGHDTPTDHKQSLCENFQCLSFKKNMDQTFTILHTKIKTRHTFCTFPARDLDLAQMTFG